jgi:pimeloyl-ACP methyl ester carboxylesterase
MASAERMPTARPLYVRPMPTDRELIDVPVTGGTLRVARWGNGPNVALAAHGITASSMSWAAVARHLVDGDDSDAGWTLLVPDLRGRGESRHLPPPYGLQAHADDLLAVAAHFGVDRAVLTGHSMGAYVVAVVASTTPAIASRLVLVDGGLPLPRAEGADPDEVLAATIGPALARLSMTFDGPDDYVAFWRQHPAFAAWTDDIEAYVRYDLTGDSGAMRSKASEDAVRADGRDLFLGQSIIEAAVRAVKCPVALLRAPRGLFDEPGGLLPAALVEQWAPAFADLTVTTVPDTNHYSIMLGRPGPEAVAAAIAVRSPG